MPSDPADIAHLLRRSGFVAPPARVADLAALDWPDAVEAVLDTTADPAEGLPDGLLTSGGEPWRQHITWSHWWLDRCATTPTPLVEKMALFWQGHFVSSFSRVYNVPALIAQHRIVRRHGLGDFRELAQQIAVDPAMLWYLDNFLNVRSSPNQNFARELMELFLLGVGNYTEDDVVAVARAWTGHGTVDYRTAEYRFRPEQHDDGAKTLFGITRNWDGPQVIDEILYGARREVAARFLARKLWTFFAHERPTDALVEAVAQAFLAADLDIRSALRVIFNRPEFRSLEARQGLVRSPIEYVVAVRHAFGVPCAELHPDWTLGLMGQVPFNPPNVSGWRPNGYWVNSSAFSGRGQFAANTAVVLKNKGVWANLLAGPDTAAVATAEATLGVTFSDATRRALLEWLPVQRAGQESWAMLQNFITLVLLSPELHLA